MIDKNDLWETATKLRGNIASSDYKDIVLGLLFLKYADMEFNKIYNELLKTTPEFKDDVDEYTSHKVFYLPQEARFDFLLSSPTGEINKKLDDALNLIMRDNPTLKNVLNPCFIRLDADGIKIIDVMKVIANILEDKEVLSNSDYLGEVYMYFLGMFARSEGSKGGEYFTPECIVELMVRLVEPFEGKLYDPACGSGGMFIHAIDLIKKNKKDEDKLEIYGQELNTTTWRLAKLNMAVHRLNANLGDKGTDTFLDDIHKTLKADYILANPPFNLKDWGRDHVLEDIRWKYGVPPKNNANYAWISHMMHHLSDTGTMAMILANGSLSTSTSEELAIRKSLIDANKVEAIISLPEKLFLTTGIPVCIWILKNHKVSDDILFIDASSLGIMETRALRVLEENDIQSITNLYHNFRDNKEVIDTKGFAKQVKVQDVIDNNYVLTPGRFVGIEEEIDDGIPFEVKVKELNDELLSLFEKNKELEEKIKEGMENE